MKAERAAGLAAPHSTVAAAEPVAVTNDSERDASAGATTGAANQDALEANPQATEEAEQPPAVEEAAAPAEAAAPTQTDTAPPQSRTPPEAAEEAASEEAERTDDPAPAELDDGGNFR